MKKKLKDLFGDYDLPQAPNASIGKIAVYQKQFKGGQLQINRMHLGLHGRLLHQWCNQPYAARFWQMQGSYKDFKAFYAKKIKQQNAFFFMVYLDELPVAFTEVYQVKEDELANHVAAQAGDFGIHFLMCPYRQLPAPLIKSSKGLATYTLITMLDFLMHILMIEQVYVEPDTLNTAACRLAEEVGFQFLRSIQLSDKTANLYQYKRDNYVKEHPLEAAPYRPSTPKQSS